ncbi:phosphatidate cytidylyltransferase [Candidatus Caldatribacterium sp.]|uniref:phosphatidate cytidylyltransferase n=1 Tax=Candidatus Caldatribacterium sp. TaxID=2282143 RepID=UPI002991DFBF|nr:phosphatidate cytidylyltransferase [Candidatus Caldatribacterium sp.]MDW8080747.1 phosphatidate cytidylyltransferase [Candidatus Calescibacterium sp.]
MRRSVSFAEDLKVRTITIVLFLPLFLVFVLASRITMVGIFLAVAFLAFWEYLVVSFGKREFFPLVLGVGVLTWMYIAPWIAERIWLFGWYVCALLLLGWAIQDVAKCLERASFFLFGVFYCFVLPFFWVQTGLKFSSKLLLFFALLVWINDILAYVFGIRWGCHKVLPAISPGKSWEGFLGGVGGAVLGSLFLGWLFRFPLGWSCLCGCSIPPFAFFGDVFESALKRRVGLKDSGSLLPGHGGVLDRFDGFFVVGPLVYFLASLGRG